MNRGLLIVSAILIIAGVVSTLTPLIILGVFLLLPALATGRRARTQQRSGPEPKRGPSSEAAQPRQTPAPILPEATPQTPSAPQSRTESAVLPPLFPSQMFPTLNPVQFEARVQKETGPRGDEIPEELVEMAAIFLLGMFLSRRRR